MAARRYTAKVIRDVDPAELRPLRPWRRRFCISGLFVLLTVAMTWPNARVLATHSIEHQDIFFNIWRLAWVHHALVTSPLQLFDANQFHPEKGVLAYSDAMPLESFIAAPLFAMRLPPMLIHNLLLLGAIASSGIGMFTLARYLWRDNAAAVLAGIIFAFAPYRFAHYMHMELQWTMWIPWAFWAMQRTLETGRLKFGVLTGLFIALQMVSSVYYGIFLVVLLSIVGLVQLVRVAPAARAATAGAFAAGAVLTIGVAAIYSKPYRDATARVGVRSLAEIFEYSAKPSSYLRVTHGNYLYGRSRADGAELSLFPGYVPALLALAAVALMRPSVLVMSYVLGLALAFDLSLGLNGLVYPWLHGHITVFKGLRAPARASIFFLLFLAVLAARVCAGALPSLRPRLRAAAIVAATAVVMLEYWVVPLRLMAYPVRPPLYEFLARQPDGVVIEFPVPRLDRLPGHDGRYAYFSIYHWKPLANGYSGYYPPSYLNRMERMVTFPDRRSLDQLRADGVRYIVVHESSYIRPLEAATILDSLARAGVRPIARLHDGWGAATVFELK
jgi:hypothetical protein